MRADASRKNAPRLFARDSLEITPPRFSLTISSLVSAFALLRMAIDKTTIRKYTLRVTYAFSVFHDMFSARARQESRKGFPQAGKRRLNQSKGGEFARTKSGFQEPAVLFAPTRTHPIAYSLSHEFPATFLRAPLEPRRGNSPFARLAAEKTPSVAYMMMVGFGARFARSRTIADCAEGAEEASHFSRGSASVLRQFQIL